MKGELVLRTNIVKYLDLTLDPRLLWKAHVKKKRE